jgi:hypothetical protein
LAAEGVAGWSKKLLRLNKLNGGRRRLRPGVRNYDLVNTIKIKKMYGNPKKIQNNTAVRKKNVTALDHRN